MELTAGLDARRAVEYERVPQLVPCVTQLDDLKLYIEA